MIASLLTEAPTAQFTQDNAWVVILKAVLIFAFCVVVTLLMILSLIHI